MTAWLSLHKPPNLIIIALLAAVLWGGEYARRALWEPDEARYAYVAKEMQQSGHWAVPHRHGVFYAHKPPLMFWMIRASSFLTGGDINRISTRIPSWMGIVLTLWAMSRLITLWHRPASGWRSVFILSTAPLFWMTGGMGQIDALLCGLEMMALYHLFLWNREPERYRLWIAFSCMGLAVLAKGPVGFLVPTGAYIAGSLMGGDARRLLAWHWAWGPLLVLVFPALWLWAAWFEGAPPEYFRELLWKQNVERAAGEMGHVRSFHYFLLHFPVEFLPWTFLLPAAVGFLWRDADRRTTVRRLLAWILFVIVFFSLSISKRNLYILPAYPAAAMLVAMAWDGLAVRPGYIPGLVMILYLLTGVLALTTGLDFALPVPVSWFAWTAAGAGMAAMVLLVVWVIPRWRQHWIATICLVSLATQLAIVHQLYPALNPFKTPVDVIVAARTHLSSRNRLILYGLNSEILPLYTNSRGIRIDDQEILWYELFQQVTGMVIFDAPTWQQLKGRYGHIMDAHSFQMGAKQFVWCAFDVRRQP